MKRKETRPLQKVTLNLYHGDFEKLQEQNPRIGAAKVVRELVSAHVRTVEAKAESLRDQLDIEEVLKNG